MKNSLAQVEDAIVRYNIYAMIMGNTKKLILILFLKGGIWMYCPMMCKKQHTEYRLYIELAEK